MPLLLLASFLLSAPFSPAFAHGGPPLRLGVEAGPASSAVARLAMVHLREGVGFAVDWREFADGPALRAAFAAGKIDIAVVLAAEGAPAPPPSAPDCPSAALGPFAEGLGRRWGGAAFLLGFPQVPGSCARHALIVARAVLEDLRFGILGKEAGRIAAMIVAEDVAAVSAAAARGGERAATVAARAALDAKARR